MTERPERMALIGLTKGGGEKDTVKITEEVDATGQKTTKTERTEKRRPGQGGAGKDESDPIKAAMDAARLAREKQSGAKPGAAPAAKPSLMGAGQTNADPLAGLGRQQAREKRAELVTELQRWQGKPGAETRAAELQTLIDRIDNGQF